MGKIYPSDQYHYLIGTTPTDIVLPVIIVFDKNGNELSREGLVTSYGADPEYSGVSIALIRPDKTFIVIDSLFFEKYDDGKNEWIPGTGTCIASFAEYRIGNNGQISMIKSDTTRFKMEK